MPDELPTQPTPEPIPTPVVPPVTSTTTPATTASTAALTPNVAAGLAMIFTVIGGIVMLLIEKRDRFVRFWAMQAIFLGVTWFVLSIGLVLIGAVLGSIAGFLGWLWGIFSALVHLGLFVVWIIACIQAFTGKDWELPVLGKLARQQMDRLPPAV